MTDHKVRQAIRCWKCKKVFTLLIDTAGEPELSLTCPFCGAKIHINLAQYPTTITTVLRKAGNSASQDITVFMLPDIIESEPPSTL